MERAQRDCVWQDEGTSCLVDVRVGTGGKYFEAATRFLNTHPHTPSTVLCQVSLACENGLHAL